VEKHLSARLGEKFVRHGQGAMLVGLQRNFLCQHDVACYEITFRYKVPTNTRTARPIAATALLSPKRDLLVAAQPSELVKGHGQFSR
jgi:hypothetical protein